MGGSLSSEPNAAVNIKSFTYSGTKIKQRDVGTYLKKLQAELPNLNNLEVTGCRIKEIPPTISLLQNIETINLKDNKLTSIPEEFSNLYHLTELNLSNNQLAYFPPEFTNSTLKHLNLSNNQLFSLIFDKKAFPNISKLNLAENEFIQFPVALCSLDFVNSIDFRNNKTQILFDNVGNELRNLKFLTELRLDNNEISTISGAIAKLPSIEILTISNNRISTLPPQFANLTSLEVLELQHNNFSVFPSEICSITTLKILKLNGNAITEIPPSISNLGRLSELYMQENKLLFLPDSICDLSKLRKCYLEYNLLADLPDQFHKLKLIVLILHHNLITKLPESFSQMTSLLRLSLHDNPLPKDIQDTIAKHGALRLINLQSNSPIISAKEEPSAPPRGRKKVLSNLKRSKEVESGIPSFECFKDAFNSLIEDQDFSAKKKEELQKASEAEKWTLLCQYKKSTLTLLRQAQPPPPSAFKRVSPKSVSNNSIVKRKRSAQNSAKNQAKEFVTLLREGKPSLSNLENLKLELTNHIFLSNFIDFGGISALSTYLISICTNSSLRLELDSNVIQQECLEIFSIMMGYSFKSVVTTSSAVTSMAYVLACADPEVKYQCISVLNIICKSAYIGAELVAEGLYQYAQNNNEQYQYFALLEILRNDNTSISVKTSSFFLINATINAIEDLHERFTLRIQLVQMGIQDIILSIRSMCDKLLSDVEKGAALNQTLNLPKKGTSQRITSPRNRQFEPPSLSPRSNNNNNSDNNNNNTIIPTCSPPPRNNNQLELNLPPRVINPTSISPRNNNNNNNNSNITQSSTTPQEQQLPLSPRGNNRGNDQSGPILRARHNLPLSPRNRPRAEHTATQHEVSFDLNSDQQQNNINNTTINTTTSSSGGGSTSPTKHSHNTNVLSISLELVTSLKNECLEFEEELMFDYEDLKSVRRKRSAPLIKHRSVSCISMYIYTRTFQTFFSLPLKSLVLVRECFNLIVKHFNISKPEEYGISAESENEDKWLKPEENLVLYLKVATTLEFKLLPWNLQIMIVATSVPVTLTISPYSTCSEIVSTIITTMSLNPNSEYSLQLPTYGKLDDSNMLCSYHDLYDHPSNRNKLQLIEKPIRLKCKVLIGGHSWQIIDFDPSIRVTEALSQILISNIQNTNNTIRDRSNLCRNLTKSENMLPELERENSLISNYKIMVDTPDSSLEIRENIVFSSIPNFREILLVRVERRVENDGEGGSLSQHDDDIWEEGDDSPQNITFELYSPPKIDNLETATLNKLIERLTSPDEHSNEFMAMFVYTYPNYMTDDQLLAKLIARFNVPEWCDVSVVQKIQIKIAIFLKYWIDLIPSLVGTPIRYQILAFVQNKMTAPHLALPSRVVNERLHFIKIPKQQSIDKLPAPILPKTSPPFVFYDIDELELARQLTIQTFNIYKKILPREFLKLAWTKEKTSHLSPNILQMIDHYNAVSTWVATAIISVPKVRERAKLFQRLINVADKLRDLQNFHLLSAFISGFNNSALLRLKYTKARISKRQLAVLTALEDLVSMESSFANYRNALTAAKPPSIPFLGVHLTDLVFITDGNPDMVEKRINVGKYKLIYSVISIIKKHQEVPYKYEVVASIVNFLNSLKSMDNNQLYATSLLIEPRNASSSEIL